MAGPLDHYLRGLETSTKNNSLAYGYSVAISATFGALDHFHPGPTIVELFLFCVGAGAAFAVINAGVTRGYRSHPPDEPAVVIALGTSFGVVSITAAVAAGAALAWTIGSWPAWLLTSFLATVVYVLAVGVEMALAGALHDEGAHR